MEKDNEQTPKKETKVAEQKDRTKKLIVQSNVKPSAGYSYQANENVK